MELIHDLFCGSPEFWGGRVAHSVLILSLVISIGLCLGKIKVENIHPFVMFLRIISIQIFVLVLE